MPQASSCGIPLVSCKPLPYVSCKPGGPDLIFPKTSDQEPPHIRHHHHKYCFDRSDYLNYWGVLDKMRRGHGVPYDSLGAPFALDDDIVGAKRYFPLEYKPAPWYRHRTWWREPGIRPWEHEDLVHHSRPTRGPGLNPWVLSTSANAPWATYHNEPLQEAV